MRIGWLLLGIILALSSVPSLWIATTTPFLLTRAVGISILAALLAWSVVMLGLGGWAIIIGVRSLTVHSYDGPELTGGVEISGYRMIYFSKEYLVLARTQVVPVWLYVILFFIGILPLFIVWLIGSRMERKKRLKLSELTVGEILNSHGKNCRIPYSDVEEVRMRKSKFEVIARQPSMQVQVAQRFTDNFKPFEKDTYKLEGSIIKRYLENWWSLVESAAPGKIKAL